MLSNKLLDGKDKAFTTFFNETSAIKHVPHCMFLDLKPMVVDEVRIGTYC